MWLSQQLKPAASTMDAELGVTTIAGENAGAAVRGEVRDMPLYGPGGYIWLPDSGDGVLVIKGGPGGEERCVAGKKQAAAPAGMLPGEVYIFSPGGASLFLHRDGTIELKGRRVSIQGELEVNGQDYQPCES